MVALKYLIMRDKIFIAINMEYMLLVKHAGVCTNSNHMPNKITITWQQCGSTLTVHIHSDLMGQRLQQFGSYHYKDCKNMVATIGDFTNDLFLLMMPSNSFIFE